MDRRITEQRNPRTVDIDLASPLDIVDLIGAEDRLIADAVASQRTAIAQVIGAVERAFRSGRRLLYVGAGTSGRLGVLDASECPPTFGSDPAMVVGIIAGGDRALRISAEGAEDDPEGGVLAVRDAGVQQGDVVVGLAASGTTPYVRGALGEARARGAMTAIVACSPPPDAMLAVSDVAIVPIVGPEVLTGSTRMKAGTAQKMVVNMITTGGMIRIGKTYGNLMVDLKATNAKLADRAERMLMEVTGEGRAAARTLLAEAGGSVKLGIVMHAVGVPREVAETMLDDADGSIRQVVGPPPAVTSAERPA